MPDAHGTRTAYKKGCKCLKCRAANAQYEASYRWRRLLARFQESEDTLIREGGQSDTPQNP